MHCLELDWYALNSLHYTKFVEGEQLDHLGLRGRIRRDPEEAHECGLSCNDRTHSRRELAFVKEV